MALPQKAVREDFKWDVFLSYHNPDDISVEQIAKKLTERELKVWWDRWEVAPGDDFQEKLWEGLTRSWATAVFIGPKTLGRWQDKEVKAAIDKQVNDGKPVFAVFLPGIPEPDKVDIGFLKLFSRVAFESLNEERALNRIYFGITGINLERPRLRPAVATKPAAPVDATATDESLAWLAEWLRSRNVTFFIGPGATGGGPSLPPRNWEIARDLIREMKLIEPHDLRFLPPMDIAATLFAVSKTDPVLENTIVRLIESRSLSIPTAHQNLVTLLARLGKREFPRGRKPQKQLILTTNIDLMLERAMLGGGVPFTRVVQHKSQPSLYVTDLHDVPVIPSQRDQVDDLIARAGGKEFSPEAVAADILPDPILYKLRGSLDIEGSCALTRPQLLAQARSAIADHLIPAELQKIASNTPLVFLGTGLLDPDFLYTSNTVLFDAWKSEHPKYVVQLSPEQDHEDAYRQVETGIWDKIKQSGLRRNVTTVEESSDRFLQRLIDVW